MTTVEYLVKIVTYFLLVGLIYLLIKTEYKSHVSYGYVIGKRPPKLSVFTALFIAFLLAVYGVSSYHSQHSDHYFYITQFEYGNIAGMYDYSFGLGIIYEIFYCFTKNGYIMCGFVIMLGAFLTFIAYRQQESIKPEVMLILLASEFWINGLVWLKQIVAIGFAFLFFVYYFKRQEKLAMIFIVAACAFHKTSVVLLAVYVVLKFSNNKKFLLGLLIVATTAVLLFPLAICAFNILLPHLPSGITNFLQSYLNDDGKFVVSYNFATTLKATPYVAIFLFGLIYRKRLIKVIKCYDEYLVLSGVVAFTFVCSFYQYWIFRFGYFMFLPVFNFQFNMLKEFKREKKGIVLFVLSFGVMLALTVRYMFQMYFMYGGL